MKKVVFGGVLVVLLATAALFGQTKVNANTQIKPNVVLTATVTITSTQLKAMAVDGTGAVVLVAYDGTHVILPLALTVVLIPGTTPYDVGDIYLGIFPQGARTDSYYAKPGGIWGLDALTPIFHFVSGLSDGGDALTAFQASLVFGGTSGTTPLTLGDSSLQVTVAYMLI